MVYLPITQSLSAWLDGSEALSALPDAPVVPYVERVPHLRRTRAASAAVLYWLGDVMARARPARSPWTLG
jgi:hypothetical protein